MPSIKKGLPDLRGTNAAKKLTGKATKPGIASRIRGAQDAGKTGLSEKDALNTANKYAAKGISKLSSKAMDTAIDKAGLATAEFTGGLSIAAAQIVKRHKREFFIIVLIAILATLLPLLLIFYLLLGTESIIQQQQQKQNPLQISKTGPSQAKLGQILDYKITVIYPGSANELVITDPIPVGTTYVSSSPKGDWSNGQVTWDAKKLNLSLSNPINISVTLTVKATRDNTNIYNTATATLTGGSIGSGGNVPHNNDTCGGKYTLNSPFQNFGDPQCNFTKQQMGQEMKQLDSSNYYTWDCMASHESGYNPDAYNPNSTSGFGAYGLLQMNPEGKGNGSYDNGTVNYPLQISNAINYNNKVIDHSFAYWATYAGCH